ncbi:hypothetical protein LVJ85_05525 [Neisseria sp. Dent CA1/247]|uniref:phage baseplate protein n=1 Tax=Neisseria sp. Dent CA1/247 TaxID=2912675 RepID=UPI001FD5A0B8|nr:hypothetical protein [Neisseria sp. Dent CA1/247]UOO77921.1 hypothetical protein LVJ85_05525 [Neisseria sp. Dent CA1/247]
MQWNSIGIPNVPKIPKNIGNALISFAGAQLINRIFGEKWGIFNQRGIPLLLADNVASVRFENKSNVSSVPVENGAFASYNKVADPYKASVMMTKASGGVMQRGAFLSLLDTFANSTDLHMIITPEAVYPNCVITGYDYIRESGNGARMIKVNVHFQEVRLVQVEYKKTKSEAGKQVDGGKVQAKEAPTAQPKESVLSRIERGYRDGGIKGALKGLSS